MDILKVCYSWIQDGCDGTLLAYALPTVSYIRARGELADISHYAFVSMFIYLFPTYQTWWLVAIQFLFM